MNIISKWKWEMLSVLSGILLTLSFAPFNYSFLSFISLTTLFLAWQYSSPSRALLRGYLYGLGLFGSGIPWIYISVHDYGGAPHIGAILLTLLAICFWAIFPALTGYLSIKLAKTGHKNKIAWTIPLVWILIEYFRGYWLLNGFPWLQIAYTQMDTPLQGFIPILGVYGTGFLLSFLASLLASELMGGLKKVKLSVIVILVTCALGIGLQRIDWTQPIGNEIKVALIQGNISQDKKWLPQNKINTLVSYKEMTEQNWDSDVIVWPETAVPAYLSQVEKNFLTPLSIEAKAHKTDIILGLPILNYEKKQYFNAVVTLGRNEARYYKNHLLPFGEYLPLQPLSGFILQSLGIQLGNFTPGGDQQKLLEAGGYPFSTSICYEDAFGGEIINTLPEATYLVNVTNDAWFGDSIEPHQHMQIAQMRALETGRYLLRATNTGVTAIVSPKGKIIKQAPLFKKTVLKGSIYPMGGMTPYARLGDNVIIILLMIGLVFVLSIRLRK